MRVSNETTGRMTTKSILKMVRVLCFFFWLRILLICLRVSLSMRAVEFLNFNAQELWTSQFKGFESWTLSGTISFSIVGSFPSEGKTLSPPLLKNPNILENILVWSSYLLIIQSSYKCCTPQASCCFNLNLQKIKYPTEFIILTPLLPPADILKNPIPQF